MKKLFALVCILILSACAPLSIDSAKMAAQTPAQVAAKVCPPLTATVTGIQALVGLDPAVIKALDDANKVIVPVCSADFSSLAGGDIKSMVMASVPKLVAVIKMTSLSDDKKNEAILIVEAAQIALSNLP